MREDLQHYKSVAKSVADAFGTTVLCTEKYGRLRVDFDESLLAEDQATAVRAVADLIELVTEFPPGYLETLDAPVPRTV